MANQAADFVAGSFNDDPQIAGHLRARREVIGRVTMLTSV